MQDNLGSLHYGTVKHIYTFLRTDVNPFHIRNQYSNIQFPKCTLCITVVGVSSVIADGVAINEC